MRVALIQLPHFFGDGLSRAPENYPLGLGYLSNVLTENQITHDGIDLWGLQYSVEEAFEKVDFSRYDFFVISAYVTQYKYFKELSFRLKERWPGVPIICGGPGPTFSSEVFLKHTGADVCVLGEGELTLPDLLQNFHHPESVKGIAFLKEGVVHLTPSREAIAELDSLKFPNRELFNFEKILATAAAERSKGRNVWQRDKVRRSADIVAGRGCPYNCNYCSKTFQKLRLRSVDNIMAEIRELIEKYGINHLNFNDELLLVNKGRTFQLCDELKKLKITWSCQGHINQVNKEILAAMKDSGCIEVGYGVESISQSILDRMNKRVKSEKIVPVIKMTQEVGIKPIIQYMYGYPGENEETIKATFRFFKEIDYPFISFTTTPLPGTQLYRECLEKGLVKDEDDYMMRLDSGYNVAGALINMTEFSDQEFLARKRWLRITATHNYLKKRPLEYATYIFDFMGRRLNRFMNKLKSKGAKLWAPKASTSSLKQA